MTADAPTPRVDSLSTTLASIAACRPLLRVRIVGRKDQIVGHWVVRETEVPEAPGTRVCALSVWSGGDSWKRTENMTAQAAMDALCQAISQHMHSTWQRAVQQLTVCQEMARTHANLQHRGFRRGAISKISANQARNLEADMRNYRASCDSLVEHHLVHAHEVDGWPKPTFVIRMPWRAEP